MAYLLRKNTLVVAATVALVSGCATEKVDERVERNVEFSGFYNEISGNLSDGSAVSGVAWFSGGRPGGDFCLQTEETVCSGKYSAGISRRISGEFVCSNGIIGSYKTERIPEGDFVVPVKGTGSLSDGRSARVVFSELKRGSGTTRCLGSAKS
ncbi:hypothetical protein [Ruegeria sp. MALMAid1280]|uniref:hypothetical protein n=1 Tax=Ruegeria sp. MALMAid1280 TaxID=3411634 RepID=UPI003B9E767F